MNELELKQETSFPGKQTIFYVDSCNDILDRLQTYFKPDYNCIYAKNSREALTKLRNTNCTPDIIISNTVIDTINGFDFLKIITKMDKYKSVPFIFLTADGGPEERIRCFESGAVDVINQTVSTIEFKAKIKSLLMMISNLTLTNWRKIKDSTLYRNDSRNKGALLRDFYERYHITHREQDIIENVIEGYEQKEIAANLKISVHTVKKHIGNIYNKCAVQNKIELINSINRH